MVCLELQRGRGRHTSSHRAQRLPQGQSGTFFWGSRTHYGARHDIEVGCWMSLGYLFIGGFAGHAWDRVFSTRKTLSEQSRVKLGL